jgi:uncharacterized membrane protein YfcA
MWQSVLEYAWLCLSAFLAGGINALAGGGTLLTFPALIAALRRPFGDAAGMVANCTSTVALIPASLGSAWAFRRELHLLRHLLMWLTPPSVVGGAIGAWLLIRFPDRFNTLIPWLILTATLLFLLQPLLVRHKPMVAAEDGRAQPSSGRDEVTAARLAGMVLLQFFIAIYGGYFGAGIGILMLSGLGLMGLRNIHEMNGLKCLLGGAINSVAVVIFIVGSKVYWPYALAMMATSLVGGYFAAHFGRRIPGKYVRLFVVAIGCVLAAYFFSGRG